MKNKLISGALVAIVVCSYSCGDDNNETLPAPVTTTYAGTTDFFIKNAVTSQTFTIPLAGDTITGNKGTQLIIPANAFVDANNMPVTGPVTVKLQEIYDKEDMFLSKMTTTYYGYPLVSAGMFKFEPTYNGSPVTFAPGKEYTARVPANVIDNNMGLFFADIDSNQNANWVPPDSMGGSLQYNNTVLPYCYIFSDTTIRWTNVDVFYWNPADISITVNTLNNPNPDSTFACVWFTGFNALWDLHQNNLDHSVFASSHVKPVPSSLIAITISNGKIFAGIVTYPTLTDNGTYTITMQEMSESAFKAAIAALN